MKAKLTKIFWTLPKHSSKKHGHISSSNYAAVNAGQLMQFQKPTVLFYEENEHALNTLMSQFERSYQVFGVTQESDIYAFVERQPVHCVVCPQQLSQTTGVSILRNIRNVSPKSARILLISHKDLAAMPDTVVEGDIYRYVTTPWQHGVLAQALESAVVFSSHLAVKAVNDSQVLQVYDAQLHDNKPHDDRQNILIIDDCMQTYDSLYHHFGNHCHIVWAKSIDQAIHATKQQAFSVIVSDATLNGVNILNLLSSFKEKTPHSMIILLARIQETEHLAGLIHTAKVFRCLPKSVRANLLQMSVHRAMLQHKVLKSDAAYQAVQSTNTTKDISETSTISVKPNRIA